MAVRKTWKNDWLTFVTELTRCVVDQMDEEAIRQKFCGKGVSWTGMYFSKRVEWSNYVDIRMPGFPRLIDGRKVITAGVGLTQSDEQMAAWNQLKFGQIVEVSPTFTMAEKKLFPSIRWSGSDPLIIIVSPSSGTLIRPVNEEEIEYLEWENLYEKLDTELAKTQESSRVQNSGESVEDDPSPVTSPNTPVLRPPTKAEKVRIDFDVLEEKLDLVVPNVYRMFVEAAVAKNCNLPLYGIYHTTETIIKANTTLRRHLADADPSWQDHYLDFGLGDGVGNYFFLHATDEDDDLVELWSHDPAGIEKVSSATKFLKQVLAELECGFTGPNHDRFEGNGPFAK